MEGLAIRLARKRSQAWLGESPWIGAISKLEGRVIGALHDGDLGSYLKSGLRREGPRFWTWDLGQEEYKMELGFESREQCFKGDGYTSRGGLEK